MPRLKVKRCGLAEHCRRVCLVAPRHPESFWSLQGTVDLMGAKTLVPNSALATLIALTPSDAGVEFVLGDENVSAVDLDLPCDLVAITRSLLTELVKWNRAQTRPLSFSTQITVQVADDEELLRLFADALFRVLFVGVETPRRECLEEVHKVHNLDRPLEERLRAISRFGIVPFLGLIVGFDGDDLSVFDEMYSFIDETASPVAGISMLNAPRHTPLYERLSREGRLAGDDFSGEWQLETNIVPKQMTREELARGYWELFARVYDPERFDERLQRWLSTVEYYGERGYATGKMDLQEVWMMLRVLGKFLFRSDRTMRQLFLRNIARGTRIRMFTLLAQYRHFRDFVSRERTLPVD